MELEGELNKGGILNGIEYGDLKKMFRGHLDEQYDHRVLLNIDDPWAKPVMLLDRDKEGQFTVESDVTKLPGLRPCPGDPTTENIALWIGNAMEDMLDEKDIKSLKVEVWETSVNMAAYYFDHTL
jgi:6-pyruvoyl-tetrahydropterin synthase